MRVLVLGPLEIESDDPQPLSPRDRVVLAALLVRLGGPLSAEELADALWGEEHPASWLKVVHGCVSRLRRTLGAGAIETVPVGYRLRSDAVDLDTVDFESLAQRGHQYADAGAPERAIGLFEQALALWRGRPFDELDEWIPGRLEAGRLGELRLGVEEDLLQARLDQGDHRAVAAAATVATGEEPWRERRWALLALAQYREGRQADALSSIRRARGALGRDLGLDPGSELVALEQAILKQDPSLAGDHEARIASSDCPWKGLSSYALSDQDGFFGRSAEVAAALARLDAHPLLVLAGPSGSGKSSLMLAGLAPALLRRGLEVVTFSPGTDPAIATSTARLGARRDPVLLVDQFEEAFTIAGPDVDVAAWLAELATYASSRAPVAVTLRADQLIHLTLEPSFARMAEEGVHLVAPLEGTGLREAIEAPARLAGLRLEQGLVELMMRDTEGQAGALPLLSHALVETWRRRERGLLTVEGYRASGGMRGAVAASAERLYEGLTLVERAQLRRLMLRMVTLSDGGEPIRSQLPVSSVANDPARRRVLERLARARLVTTGADSFELAHEALARAWPRLRSWLDEGVEEQQLVRHLAAAAAGWDALGRSESELYRGARLQIATEWLSGEDADPTPLEEEFLAASQALADDVGLERELQIRHERRQNRRLRVLLAGVAALLLVAAGVGGLALDRGRDAARDRDLAEEASAAAAHEALVGRSLTLRATNRSVAALLAVQAFRARPDHLSHSALLATFTASPSFGSYQYLEGDDRLNAAGIPQTQRAIVAGDSGHLGLLSTSTGALTHPFGPPLPRAQDYSVLRVSKDGTRVAQLLFTPRDPSRCGSLDSVEDQDGQGCSSLVVHDVDSGERVLGPLELPFSGADLALSDYGEMVAVTGGYDGDLVTYDVVTGHRLAHLDGLPRPRGVELWRDTAAVAFNPAGDVYLGSMSGPVREVDGRTGQVRRTFAAPRLSSHVGVLVTLNNVLVTAGDEALVAIDLASGRRLWAADLRSAAFSEPCPFFAVVEEVERIYCGNYFGPIEERDLATGQLTGVRLDPQLGSVGDLVATHDLVGFAAGEAAYTRWRIDGTNLIARLRRDEAEAPIGYDPTSTYLVVQDARERLPDDAPGLGTEVMEVETGELLGELPDADGFAWVGDGRLAYWGQDGGGMLDVASGRTVDIAALGAETRNVFADPRGATSWQVEELNGRTVLHEFDLVGGPDPAVFLEVDGKVYGVTSTAQGRVLVTHDAGKGVVTTAYDRETAEPLVSGMAGEIVTALSSTGRLVGANPAGDVTEFDVETLRPIASYPGASSAPSSLQFDDSGARMLVTAPDRTVQVYDSVSRTRIGDAMPSSTAEGVVEAWLRPDGAAVAVNGSFGVVEWNLDPGVLAAAACELAGRNLTVAEWSTYLGDDLAYEATCEGYPSGLTTEDMPDLA